MSRAPGRPKHHKHKCEEEPDSQPKRNKKNVVNVVLLGIILEDVKEDQLQVEVQGVL